MQKELEEAAKDTRTISPDRLKDVASAGAFFATSVPNRALVKFVSALLLTVRFYMYEGCPKSIRLYFFPR